jgi:hypothetical protein
VKGSSWKICIGIGIIFLFNAILGRYIVLPGFLSSLEAGRSSVEAVSQAVPVWKIIRYLLWAYSFKLGIFFIGIGALLKSSINVTRFYFILGGGIIYLALAYIPMPGPYSLFFGLGGSIITVLLVLIFIGWVSLREQLEGSEKTSADYQLIGYFFLAMATYNLCPLMGIKAFGLYPEKMIRFGLQSEAVSFASRIMIELILGWLFIFIGQFKRSKALP